MPDDWLRRLRIYDQYQGVRYEVAVASIFARIGCKLDFFEDKRRMPKHPEFKATDEETQVSLVVEAKSKHRAGVLHQDGDFNEWQAAKGDITQLLNKALEKETEGLPYAIFIDVNTPREPDTHTAEARWYGDDRKVIERQHASTITDPDKYAFVAITNYSHHYEGPDIVLPSQSCWVTPLYSVAPISGGQSGQFLRKLQLAINGYGYVPNI